MDKLGNQIKTIAELKFMGVPVAEDLKEIILEHGTSKVKMKVAEFGLQNVLKEDVENVKFSFRKKGEKNE